MARRGEGTIVIQILLPPLLPLLPLLTLQLHSADQSRTSPSPSHSSRGRPSAPHACFKSRTVSQKSRHKTSQNNLWRMVHQTRHVGLCCAALYNIFKHLASNAHHNLPVLPTRSTYQVHLPGPPTSATYLCHLPVPPTRFTYQVHLPVPVPPTVQPT